jgi:glycogen operon protein
MVLPVPYGAHVLEDGVQFTIVSRHAKRVWLMLFDEPDAAQPSSEIELNPDVHRLGDLWHIHVHDAHPGQYYLYRMEGPAEGAHARFYDPHQWLLDPYALAVSGAQHWGDTFGLRAGEQPRNGRAFPKGVIVQNEFDWEEDSPPHTPLSESIVYETSLRGYTAHPSADTAYPGTYRGFIDKIPYLRDLGITAVEFLPIQEFNEMEYYMENTARKKLRNFWGYSTLSFFAPNGRYAHAGVHGQQVKEFQEMVKALHEAGIEVFLDVVFNHTAEGGDGGPTFSFRGIDNSIYYMMEGEHYKNYTGCGNTVNCNHPVVRDFILDCLRYWVVQMHVDGFRFDLASILTRGADGSILANPPAVEHIAEDPALRGVKIIAEAWDAAGVYQVGSFPSKRWSEWNGRYRDDIRQFWKGDDGMLRGFVTRLIGSPDLYARDDQKPEKSVNFVSCHDGFVLNDVVSYNGKHNEANNEGNRDGENHNHSYNYGVEGPTSDSSIRRMRKRQQKNFFATLMLSQGVPMFAGGDEFARTQQGNNNAYCQDNAISWIDWSFLEEHRDLHNFVRRLITFRKRHPVFRCERFLDDRIMEGNDPDIRWFGPFGREVDWDHGKTIGCLLSCHELADDDTQADAFFMIFNAGTKSERYAVPKARNNNWQFVLSTQEQPPTWSSRHKYIRVDARSVNVLERRKR